MFLIENERKTPIGTPLGLRQFLATESHLKIMKKF